MNVQAGQGNSAQADISPTRSRPRSAVQVIAELLITLGVLFLLFAAYQLWWTNIMASWQTNQARAQIEQVLDQSAADDTNNPPPPQGTAFGLLYVPRLHDHVWSLPIIQGVDSAQLAKGVGHYPQTAMPGQIGNFAIAGHRATNGEPFAFIDEIRAGDRVFVQTADFWFTYELLQDQIVAPSETWVIGPRPLPFEQLPSDRLITITTCNPRYGSTERWIWWGVLREARPHSDGPPPEIAAEVS